MKEMAKKGAAIIWSASIFLTITDLEHPAKKRTDEIHVAKAEKVGSTLEQSQENSLSHNFESISVALFLYDKSLKLHPPWGRGGGDLPGR